jgi:hypothetical protein
LGYPDRYWNLVMKRCPSGLSRLLAKRIGLLAVTAAVAMASTVVAEPIDAGKFVLTRQEVAEKDVRNLKQQPSDPHGCKESQTRRTL